MDISFQRRRVRGGIVRIEVDGAFAGEIATCKWGYGLRLPGVYWNPATLEPARSGLTQRGFKRQKAAMAYVRELPAEVLAAAVDTCRENNLVMA